MQLQLREMRKSDLPQVLALENAIFPNPWEMSFFQEFIDEQLALVIVKGNEIIAYSCYTVFNELHIMNFAVKEKYRRQEIGSLMMERLLKIGQMQRCPFASLEVRSKNFVAIKFYQKFGFKTVGFIEDYYTSPKDKAVVMRKIISAKNRKSYIGYDWIWRLHKRTERMAKRKDHP